MAKSPTPTNPKLWSRAKAEAKKKFKVYPSAYANAWAAKWYKSKGGGWRGKDNRVKKAQSWLRKVDQASGSGRSGLTLKQESHVAGQGKTISAKATLHVALKQLQEESQRVKQGKRQDRNE